ncbi:MAG TPA: NDP-sugar synthase [bacterium]|nr:NDP-sugar synthase [bacterium]HOL46725.1 NDP-sugar synthase [bacterium]HPQ18161.1 NDP-sugar synthase [bacterium]
MKGFILAAGEGVRLKPLTNYFPKPLLPVLNLPIISYAVQQLRNAGINLLVANVWYKKEYLINYLIKEKIFISEEEYLYGTGGGLGTAKKYLLSPDIRNVIIYNGDIISNIDLRLLIKEHYSNNALMTMALYDYDKINSVAVDNDFNVVKFDTKKTEEKKYKYYTYAGISIIRRELIEKLPENQYADLIVYLKDEIKNRVGSIKGLFFNSQEYYWFDCGSIENYFYVNKFLFENIIPDENSVFVKKENLYTFKKNIFPDDIIFKGFNIVGKDVIIGNNVELKNTIIFDNAKITGNRKIENAIIDENFMILVPDIFNKNLF